MPEGNLGKQITFLSLKMYLLLLYVVYLLGGHTCHSTFVETRGQLCGVHSLLLPFHGSGDLIQVPGFAH